MKFILTIVIGAVAFPQTIFSQKSLEHVNDAAVLHRAEKALTDVIVHDIFSPPVASRIYVYSNIAAYEVLTKSGGSYPSLNGLIKGFPKINGPDKEISFPLAAIYAFLLTGRKLVFSEPIIDDSIKNILNVFKRPNITATAYNASLEFGKKVSSAIIAWASEDQYTRTRTLKRYQYFKQEGKWTPTPPGYMAAVEPYCGIL